VRIDFWFHADKNTPVLVFEEKQDLFPFARVRFTNGRERFIIMLGNSFLISSPYLSKETFDFHAPVKMKKIIRTLREAERLRE
jgi:hypothetical protein